MQTKTCTTCGDTKPIADFYADKSKSDGRRTQCKSCTSLTNKASDQRNQAARREYSREYYLRNAEKIKEKTRVWAAKNPDQKRAQDRRYAAENKDRKAASLAEWKAANPDYMQQWYARNPDYDKRWRALNQDKVTQSAKRSYDRKKDSPEFRLTSAIRAGVVKGMRKGFKSSRRTFDILGYALSDLRTHLESQFQPGMSWENYGDWHIDHIIPRSVFNYETPDDIDFKRCWALENLQPLWAADNIRKHAKLDEPFQPSLALALS